MDFLWLDDRMAFLLRCQVHHIMLASPVQFHKLNSQNCSFVSRKAMFCADTVLSNWLSSVALYSCCCWKQSPPPPHGASAGIEGKFNQSALWRDRTTAAASSNSQSSGPLCPNCLWSSISRTPPMTISASGQKGPCSWLASAQAPTRMVLDRGPST